MKSVFAEIFYLSQVAQAPPKYFRHWLAVRGFSGLVPAGVSTGVPGLVLSYKVPYGNALIVTRVDMFVSNRGTNVIVPAEPAYPSDDTVTAYWSINSKRIQTQTQTSILALGQGEQLKIFRSEDNANFHVGTTRTAAVPATTIDWQFRFNGFLTTPEIADRLTEMQTETPTYKELLNNTYEPPPIIIYPPYDPNDPNDPNNPNNPNGQYYGREYNGSLAQPSI